MGVLGWHLVATEAASELVGIGSGGEEMRSTGGAGLIEAVVIVGLAVTDPLSLPAMAERPLDG